MSQQWRGKPRPSGWENYSYSRNRLADDERLPTLGGIFTCWCGEPNGHDWPGKADGAPHPREDEPS